MAGKIDPSACGTHARSSSANNKRTFLRVHLGISHTKLSEPVGLPATISKRGRSCQSERCSPSSHLVKNRVCSVSTSPCSSVDSLSWLIVFFSVGGTSPASSNPSVCSVLARLAAGGAVSPVAPQPICIRWPVVSQYAVRSTKKMHFFPNLETAKILCCAALLTVHHKAAQTLEHTGMISEWSEAACARLLGLQRGDVCRGSKKHDRESL